MVYDQYLMVNTRGHQLIKWSVKYDCFVTPYEAMHIFENPFQYYSTTLMKSAASMYLPLSNAKAQPPKSVVSLSNFKGRCDVIDNEFSLSLFVSSIGTSNMALIPPEDIPELKSHYREIRTNLFKDGPGYVMNVLDNRDDLCYYQKLAEEEVPLTSMPENVQRFYQDNVYTPVNDYTERYGCSYQSLLPHAKQIFEKIEKIYHEWQPYVHSLIYREVEKRKNAITPINAQMYATIFAENKLPPLDATDSTSFFGNKSKSNTVCIQEKPTFREKPSLSVARLADSSHLRLWCTIGDQYGLTNEDGIIIDERLTRDGPAKMLCGTIHIKINDHKHINRKQSSINQSKCQLFFIPMGNVDGCKIYIGMLLSMRKLLTTKTSTVSVIETKVGRTYRYSFVAEQVPHEVDMAASTLELSNSSIILHYRKKLNMGVGTKLANLHGQKGICSTLDMRKTFPAGYTRTGAKVYPQVIKIINIYFSCILTFIFRFVFRRSV
jgi:hypothetical protein